MRGKIFSIWSVLLVLVVSIAVLGPGCISTPTGPIQIEATLCGQPWAGKVSYRLAPWEPGASYNCTTVPDNFDVECNTYTCEDVSGGPAGAHLVGITPGTVTVSQGETETFTLEFEADQDAAIQFLWWTVDGIPIQGYEHEVIPCQIIDARYLPHVAGCPGYNVTVNETSWLKITQVGGAGGVMIHVVDDWCAVNKTPIIIHHKASQVPSFNGTPVGKNMSFPLSLNVSVDLDVETAWRLVKCINYTETINWFGISKAPFEPGAHPCVLFELVVPDPGQYVFTLQTSASVELVGDVNHQNDSTGWSPTLFLWVNA